MKYLTPIDLAKNELQNARIQNLATPPASPVLGQIYFDTTSNVIRCWDGTAWKILDVTGVAAGTITLDKLAVDPLARANHTGTQTASTISDLATVVKAYKLNEFAAPIAAVSMGNQKITNLAAPTAGSTDAARMIDVETAVNSAAAGIDSKASVRLIAVGNVATSGLTAIDGVTPVAGDRILLVGQTTASQNGVYVAASGTWARAADADATGEITPGAFWFVEEGTTYGKTQWRCNNTGAITIGTTGITIVQFGAANTYTAGNGLTLSGNDFNVGGGTGITVTADAVAIDTNTVVRKVAATIGDGTATSFTVTHNLNNQDVMTQVREIATNQVVIVDIQNNGVNTVVIQFASAPAANSYRVVVQG
jgi:hypothetical protein